LSVVAATGPKRRTTRAPTPFSLLLPSIVLTLSKTVVMSNSNDMRQGTPGGAFHAGSKRPCPSGDGDGDPASQHQRASSTRPLSLLARCALNREGDNPANSQNGMAADQNHQFQPPSVSVMAPVGGGVGGVATQLQQSTVLQLPAAHAQNVQYNLAPQVATQSFPLQVVNPQVNQLAGMQPHAIVAQGQTPHTVPHPQLGAMQVANGAIGAGALLRPFGMTPQELLNYA